MSYIFIIITSTRNGFDWPTYLYQFVCQIFKCIYKGFYESLYHLTELFNLIADREVINFMYPFIKTIAVVLPTYNGEKYIQQQINSILSQTVQNWYLYIRDDNSNDKTPQIIREYSKKFPDKITVITDRKGNLGVTNNVFEILSYVNNEYIMFCDQDDIWNKNKIKVLYNYIRIKEKEFPDIPLLVHSDSIIVDKNLNIICDSFTNYASLNRKNSNLSNLLQFNIVQGSSSIFNKKLFFKLKNLFGKPINSKIYHDWWCALTAAAFGKIFFCNKPLMLYRQHTKNLVGVGYLRKKSIKEIFEDKGTDLKITNYCKVNRIICRKFLECNEKDLSEIQVQIIGHYYNRPNDFGEFLRLRLYRDYSLKEIITMFLVGIE